MSTEHKNWRAVTHAKRLGDDLVVELYGGEHDVYTDDELLNGEYAHATYIGTVNIAPTIDPNGQSSVARLIAAAPDLLEALENLLAYANAYSDKLAETIGRGAEELGENAPDYGCAGMARAAIAKARDEKQPLI